MNAIIYLLWPKNLEILNKYLEMNGPRLIITLSYYHSPELEELGTRYNSKIVIANDIRSAGRRAAINDTSVAMLADVNRCLDHLDTRQIENAAAIGAIASSASALLPILISTVSTLDELAAEHPVELVLLNEDWMPISKTVALWARKRFITSLHVAHNPFVTPISGVHAEQNSDAIAVFGPIDRELLIDARFVKERIYCTGLPQFDALAQHRDNRHYWRKQICAWHGFEPAKPIVVYGTTWASNLSTLEEPALATIALSAYFSAIQTLGDKVQHIIKDRPATGPDGKLLVQAVAARFGISDNQYAYAADTPTSSQIITERPLPYLLGADLIVATNSGLSIEALCVGTRTVNLIASCDHPFGFAFPGDCGIRQATAENLADTILATLLDESIPAQMAAALPRINAGHQQNASARIAQLMAELALKNPAIIPYQPDPAPPKQRQIPVWKTHLGVEDINATGYHGGARKDLVEMSPRPIRCALDIGCAAGGTGAYIKEKYPKARVIGIEMNRAAAAIAATRLDTVLVGKFEDIDFEAAGIRPGDIDTVIVADVLEHMYDPWAVLTRLQRYLSSDGQIIASIPNVRNLKLMEDLAAGYWRYEPAGLLDVTHIRFFTLRELRRFFHETGYHIRKLVYGIDARLQGFYNANPGKASLNVEFGRMSLRDVTQEELKELCSLQFYILAQTGALAQDMELYSQIDPYQVYITESRPTLEHGFGLLWDQHLATWQSLPEIELMLFDTSGNTAAVIATIGYLANQLYSGTLTIISDLPPPEGFSSNDRLRWLIKNVDETLLGAANRVLANSTSQWIGRLFPGDKLEETALLRLMELAHRHPDAECLYTDDDTLLLDSISQPRLKPDFDPDLLLGWCYLEGLTLFRRETLNRLGGFDQSLRGAEIHDLALKLYETNGSLAFAHLPNPACHRPPTGNDNDLPGGTLVAARQKAIQAHLDRTGKTATIASGWQLGSFRIDRTLQKWPRVSILLLISDQLPLVQETIEAIFEKTRYADFELLLLDNPIRDSALRAYLADLDQLDDDRLKVFTQPEPATPPALFNLLAAQASGEVLVCLDANCSPLSPDWLENLVANAWRPEIGVVAPRLLNAKGEIVRSALIAGCGGSSSDAFAGRTLSDSGPDGRAHQVQRFSALPFGCLVLRSEVYRAAQGFDSTEIDADLAALDLTLRLTTAGLACLWTPYVSILCRQADAIAEAGVKDASDQAAPPLDSHRLDTIYARHLPLLARDPAYHPALSMAGPPFELETRPALFKDHLPWRPLPKILAAVADTHGCGHYRIILPAITLNQHYKATVEYSSAAFSVPELARIAPDALVLQRQLTDPQIERTAEIRRHFSFPVHFELDDLVTDIPKNSVHRGEIPKDISNRLRKALGLVDTFIVSTEALKVAYDNYHHKILVVPNRLSRERWQNLAKPYKNHRRPRVGWSGSVSHTGDLLIIADVVQNLAAEVDWIFMGHCPSQLRPFISEYHHGVPFSEYPEALAALDLDLAIAPLEQNQFNECKSNLKLLEYGILGYPVIATNIHPYQGELPVTLVKNKFAPWVKAIREHVADRDELARRGAALRIEVEKNWMLEDHLTDWLEAWTSK
ncbi:methyltransferase domain-containing protein [Propionivibrio sp.]|uniref:methyltransferase domain-containing protein n=1 Tax=Propionivibrio sp. TaxID=2212460 RepID=UPI003BF04D80